MEMMMDWSYVAGYFDGEGHARCKAPPSTGGRKVISLSWANTHIGSLEAIRDFIGCGRVSIRPMRGMMRKPAGELQVRRVLEVIRVGEAMLPHLIVKRQAVEELLAHAKANIKPAPTKWGLLTAIGSDEIRRLYVEEKMTQQQIAARVGVSPGGVASFMVRQGIKGIRKGADEGAFGILASHGKEKLMSMYQSGMTCAEIAESLGVRDGTVRQWFWVRGVKLTKGVRRARSARRTLTAGGA